MLQIIKWCTSWCKLLWAIFNIITTQIKVLWNIMPCWLVNSYSAASQKTWIFINTTVELQFLHIHNTLIIINEVKSKFHTKIKFSNLSRLQNSSSLSECGAQLQTLWQAPKSYCALQKERTNVFVYYHKFGWIIKMVQVLSFLFTFILIKQSVKYIMYVISK